MDNNALSRVVYISNIVSFSTRYPPRLLELSHVSRDWEDTVCNYMQETWDKVVGIGRAEAFTASILCKKYKEARRVLHTCQDNRLKPPYNYIKSGCNAWIDSDFRMLHILRFFETEFCPPEENEVEMIVAMARGDVHSDEHRDKLLEALGKQMKWSWKHPIELWKHTVHISMPSVEFLSWFRKSYPTSVVPVSYLYHLITNIKNIVIPLLRAGYECKELTRDWKPLGFESEEDCLKAFTSIEMWNKFVDISGGACMPSFFHMLQWFAYA